jgi:hypothetical protein
MKTPVTPLHVEAVQPYPEFGLFVQDPPGASSAEQSPVSAAFVRRTEASQVANTNKITSGKNDE